METKKSLFLHVRCCFVLLLLLGTLILGINAADTIENEENLETWLQLQEWRTLTSDIGRPNTRSTQDVTLQYVTIRGGTGEKGAIVLSHGKGENMEKYDESFYNLMTMGYSPIYGLTHRGHGTSDRLVDDHFMTYVEKFDDYVEDFRKFVSVVMNEMDANVDDAVKPRFLVCHSVGCSISFQYLLEEYQSQSETVFHAVTAVAPAVQLVTSPFPYDVAVIIAQIMARIGLGQSYAPTQEKTFDEAWGGEGSGSSSSLERWTREQEKCFAYKNKALGADNHTGLCLGGATAQFVLELFRFFDIYESFKEDYGKMIATPILIQIAGNESVVENSATKEFCDSILISCTLSDYTESNHAIWNERDEVRNAAMMEGDDFFQSHAQAKVEQCPLPPDCGRWSYFTAQCKNNPECSYQYQFGDFLLGHSCRPNPDLLCTQR